MKILARAVLVALAVASPSAAPAGEPSASEVPSQDLNRLEREARERGRALTAEELEGAFRSWFDAGIRPRLQAARSDLAALLCVVREYQRWRSWLRVKENAAGLPEGTVVKHLAGEVDAALSAIRQGQVTAYAGAIRKCIDNRDPSQAWLILRYVRARDGIAELYALDQRLKDAPSWEGNLYVRGCLRFEVSLRSTLDGRSGDDRVRMVHTLEARSTADLHDPEDPGFDRPRGHAEELRLATLPETRGESKAASTAKLVSEWRYRKPPATDRKAPATRFEVLDLDVDLDDDAACEQPPPEPRWFVSYEIHQGPMDSEDFLTFYWRDFHQDESRALLGSTNSYRASGLEKGSGDVFVRKDYQRTKSTGGYALTEDTRIEVRHRPLGK